LTSLDHSFALIAERESGLHRALNAGKLSMIALGGAIGTGLFLGIGFAISLAGPAVILSYLLGACIALLLTGCLAEMATAHPIAGSFGAYAEYYIGPFAGFITRYLYWIGNVLAIGTEVAAISLYMQYWFPHSSGWIWSASFSAVLVYFNSTRVAVFGTIEYGLSLLKVSAITLFIVLTAGFLFRSSDSLANGLANYTAHGGFLPMGAWGAWAAAVIALFSFMGVETSSVAAGEADNPEVAVKGALRSSVLRLILFYILTLAVMLAVRPWTSLMGSVSPFVTVMQTLHVPIATHILNFVILIAALSAINSQLYIATRMMFSLARARLAPSQLGSLNGAGVPVNALFASSAGILIASVLSFVSPHSAYLVMVAISIFGGLFSWIMIFATHYQFRRRHDRSEPDRPGFRMPGFPGLTLLGLLLTLAILITTAFMEPFRLTLIFGVAALLVLTAGYFIRYRKHAHAR